jgi:hypothetical protein
MASERDMSLAAAHASRLVSVAGSSRAGIVSLYFLPAGRPGTAIAMVPTAISETHTRAPGLVSSKPRWRAPLARIQAVLLFILAQQLASLSIDKMHPGARRASDPFIFVVGRVLIIFQRMLDVHRCRRAGENERGHRQI